MVAPVSVEEAKCFRLWCGLNTSVFRCMIPWLPDSGMRTVQMHENLFIWNSKNSNIYTALSSIVSAKLIDTPFIYGFLLITPCHFQSAWCFCVSLFVLLGQACQNLFISFCCYLLVKIMPHTHESTVTGRRGESTFYSVA